jgi:Xaa-Pro aminopeptidase
MNHGANVLEQRLSILRKNMEELKIGALVLFDPPNILYLTGYWTILSSISPQALVINHTHSTLVIPALERPAADLLDHQWLNILEYRNYPLQISSVMESRRTFTDALTIVLAELDTSKAVAADLDAVKIGPGQFLQARVGGELIDFGPTIRQLRAEKDRSEVDAIRGAATIVAEAVGRAREYVVAGNTETRIASVISESVWSRGGKATHIVVGSGARSALAHAEPTDKLLNPGDLVVIDVGVLFHGYWAEIARTLVIDQPSTEQVRWHRAVKEAQAAAAKELRPGLLAEEIDIAARRILSSEGYDGRFFTHSTGHGLGILGMDAPLIAPGSFDRIPSTCALTLEPGLYFRGAGGVRIEDTYLIVDGRVEVPTSSITTDLSP